KTAAAAMTCLIFGGLVVGRAARWLRGRAAAKFVLAGAVAVLLTFTFRHAKATQPGTGALEAPARPPLCEPVGEAGEGVHV
ncbi:MAG: hypothetical protein NTW87_13510, partial [Planctomycetota bacterium]|nr:hypothetical protein [Planctomycetota bacterium]